MADSDIFQKKKALFEQVEAYRNEQAALHGSREDTISIYQLARDINAQIDRLSIDFTDVVSIPRDGRKGKIQFRHVQTVQRWGFDENNPKSGAEFWLGEDKISHYLKNKGESSKRTLDILALFFGFSGFEGFAKGERLNPRIAQTEAESKHLSKDASTKLETAQVVPSREIPKHLNSIPPLDSVESIGSESDYRAFDALFRNARILAIHGEESKARFVRTYIETKVNEFDCLCWISCSGSWRKSFLSETVLQENLRIKFEEIDGEIVRYERTFEALIALNRSGILVIDNATSESAIELYRLAEFNWKIILISNEAVKGCDNFIFPTANPENIFPAKPLLQLDSSQFANIISKKKLRKNSRKRYDVALSFADEERKYVEEVAEELKRLNVRTFYDKHEEIYIWGKDLYPHLSKVYRDYSRFCVIFMSENYAKKLWTNHELNNAQKRAFEENREYILPTRFDDTVIPGLSSSVKYIDLRNTSPIELAHKIAKKIEMDSNGETRDENPENQKNEEMAHFLIAGLLLALFTLLVIS